MQSPKSITITGTGGVVPLSASHLGAKWIQLLASADNTGPVLVGGPEVDATHGFPVLPNAYQMFPVNGAEPYGFYYLDETNAYIGASDVLYVLYGG